MHDVFSWWISPGNAAQTRNRRQDSAALSPSCTASPRFYPTVDETKALALRTPASECYRDLDEAAGAADAIVAEIPFIEAHIHHLPGGGIKNRRRSFVQLPN